ncbi:hypothetical protein [Actinobacillus vicugnae]|uniref:hypothetical protein n=1 Tax=Actinobacillus vicugnae TaxID=2573093 RepID=UPI001242B2C3|nr:hypothetical protein [Actinobacillus vicugnae]
MKNLLVALGASFLLAGCFDEPKKQDADSAQKPAEQSQAEAGVKSEEKTSKQKNAEERSSSEKSDKAVNTDKSEAKAVAPSITEAKSSTVKSVTGRDKNTEKRHKPEKSVVKKSVSSSHVTKLANKTKSAKRRKDVDGTYENGKLVSNFSPEELRVGAQTPMTANEILHEKMQCRYPFMSQQEIADNNCGVKTVTISY